MSKHAERQILQCCCKLQIRYNVLVVFAFLKSFGLLLETSIALLIMSKSVLSSASCARMSTIRGSLDKSKIARQKQILIKWLGEMQTECPSIMTKLCDLVETGLIFEIDSDPNSKHLPMDAGDVSKINRFVRKMLVNKERHTPFTREDWKKMQTANAKVVDQLFELKYDFLTKSIL